MPFCLKKDKIFLMSVFKKRETLLQNITYMAIMAAINFVFVLLTNFVPGLLFVFVFVLPLASTIVTIYCNKKYYILYLIVSLAICLPINILDTIFYVLPSLITGFLFGLLIEKKFPSIWILFITSVVQTALTYISLLVYEKISGIDVISNFAIIFGLKDFVYLTYVEHGFVFLISLVQELITFVVMLEELPKFESNLEVKDKTNIFVPIAVFVSIVLSIIFAFAYKPLAIDFMLVALFFGVFETVNILYNRTKFLLISLGVSLFVSFFLFASIYSLIEKPLGILMIQTYPLVISIIVLINNYLLKKNNKDTIKSED